MKCKNIIKGKECGWKMIHRGAFETVDGVKYKSYGCPNPECGNIELGEKLAQEEGGCWTCEYGIDEGEFRCVYNMPPGSYKIIENPDIGCDNWEKYENRAEQNEEVED